MRDDSSLEQLGDSVGKIAMTPDGMFANSLVRRSNGSVFDVGQAGLYIEPQEGDTDSTPHYTQSISQNERSAGSNRTPVTTASQNATASQRPATFIPNRYQQQQDFKTLGSATPSHQFVNSQAFGNVMQSQQYPNSQGFMTTMPNQQYNSLSTNTAPAGYAWIGQRTPQGLGQQVYYSPPQSRAVSEIRNGVTNQGSAARTQNLGEQAQNVGGQTYNYGRDTRTYEGQTVFGEPVRVNKSMNF